MNRSIILLLLIFLFVSSTFFAKQNELINIDQISNKIVGIIAGNLDEIKKEYHKIEVFKNYPFQTASLFVLSNVMINHWQANLLRNEFFASDSMNSSIIKQNFSEINFADSTSLYNNVFMRIGKYYYGVYGNRFDVQNFLSINNDDIELMFDIKINEDQLKTKEYLLDELIKYNNELEYQLSKQMIAAFNELGLMQREIMSIPVLTMNEYNALYNVANIITDELVILLQDYKNEWFIEWGNQNTDTPITFLHYFFERYNLVVTETTNKLIDLGYIKVPVPRNFNYVILIQ
ncbi:MAG: hypothetical protein M5R37_07635 [Melioribacteraceae bacterium]|nr:hypothetical protein [Melioribacteraceae bacterium]